MTGDHTTVIYGIHYPNRLFVGCLPEKAGAEDLGTFFSKFGNVVEAKVVLDEQGNSRRYGFVTFSKPEHVESVISGKEIVFKGKKINVGPAVKKNMEEKQGACKVAPKTNMKAQAPKAVNNQSFFPKTVIRRSPTECIQGQNFHYGDTSFQSLWGISNAESSIWGPSSTTNSYQLNLQQEKHFSSLNQLRSSPSNFYMGRHNNRYSNAARPPPGLERTNINYDH